MQYAPREKGGQFVQIYSEAFRRKVIEEYLTGDVSKMFLLRKYGIKMKSGIQRWMKRYGYEDYKQQVVIKFSAVMPYALIKKMNTGKASKQQLEERIRELERQLEDEKLRSEAYQRIIEKAEKDLKVPIRKKPNTR
jgi:transposase-like protein